MTGISKKSSKLSIDLERMATDPFHFDELVETWNSVFEVEQLHKSTPSSEERFDRALAALTALFATGRLATIR